MDSTRGASRRAARLDPEDLGALWRARHEDHRSTGAWKLAVVAGVEGQWSRLESVLRHAARRDLDTIVLAGDVVGPQDEPETWAQRCAELERRGLRRLVGEKERAKGLGGEDEALTRVGPILLCFGTPLRALDDRFDASETWGARSRHLEAIFARFSSLAIVGHSGPAMILTETLDQIYPPAATMSYRKASALPRWLVRCPRLGDAGELSYLEVDMNREGGATLTFHRLRLATPAES